MAIRTQAQIQSAMDARRPGSAGANHAKQERADRAEYFVSMRIQQRAKFSRQNANFASVGELTYY